MAHVKKPSCRLGTAWRRGETSRSKQEKKGSDASTSGRCGSYTERKRARKDFFRWLLGAQRDTQRLVDSHPNFAACVWCCSVWPMLLRTSRIHMKFILNSCLFFHFLSIFLSETVWFWSKDALWTALRRATALSDDELWRWAKQLETLPPPKAEQIH